MHSLSYLIEPRQYLSALSSLSLSCRSTYIYINILLLVCVENEAGMFFVDSLFDVNSLGILVIISRLLNIKVDKMVSIQGSLTHPFFLSKVPPPNPSLASFPSLNKSLLAACDSGSL